MKTNDNQSNGRRMAGNFHRIIFWVCTGLALATLFTLIFGMAVKYLWAATLTPIFDLPEITYWQAVGIIILARLVFGGFGHRPHGLKEKNDRLSRFSHRTKWHDRAGDKEATADATHLSGPDQTHYQAFWETEGKQAFEAYLAGLEKK